MLRSGGFISWSPAGLTRGSIVVARSCRKKMDCRVKPGNDAELDRIASSRADLLRGSRREELDQMLVDALGRLLLQVVPGRERLRIHEIAGELETGAAREDVLATWHQLVSLHRQWHSLLRELKDAEQALGDEPSEANMAWLRDIKARMAEADGTEALIEGFGELSGRFQRSV